MKLTRDLLQACFERVTAGATHKQVSDWLKTDHGISITPSAVHDRMQKYRSEVAGQARAEVRKDLSKSAVDLSSDLKTRLKAASAIMALCERDAAIPSPRKGRAATDAVNRWRSAAQAYAGICQLYLKASGLDAPESASITDLKSLLAPLLQREAETEEPEPEAMPEPDEDPSGEPDPDPDEIENDGFQRLE